MGQLGFTFYPKDWWTSESFYSLSPIERYFYLELLFLMYANGGSIANDKSNVERRLGTTISDNVWLKVVSLMSIEEGKITHESVNKRLRKAISNRENGKKGGRPQKNEEINPNNPELKPTENPPYKRESERENKRESEDEIETPPPNSLTFDEFYDSALKKMSPADCAKEYFSSKQYSAAIEILCMNLRIQMYELKKLALEFNEHVTIQGKIDRSLQDWAKHFGFWLKDPKRLLAHQNQHNGTESSAQKRARLLQQQQELQRNARS